MSSLTSTEKLKLETFFKMNGGYVLEYSDRTFQTFILENVGIDIDNVKYTHIGTSKANRLRAFWSQESDFNVGTLTKAMVDYWKEKREIDNSPFSEGEKVLLLSCRMIAQRLLNENSIDFNAFELVSKDKTWKKIREEIIHCLENNEPEGGLDRLHTYMMFFFRDLNEKHGISFVQDTPLHNIAGAYFKYLRENNYIESKMGERILKYSIQILDDFNDIRNNKSLSHANPILNHEEAQLIFSQISGLILFLKTIE